MGVQISPRAPKNMEELKPQYNQQEAGERIFKLQDVVRVKRSSGEIEEGWIVFYVDEEADRIVVMKKDGSTKKVPTQDLREWNR